MAHITNQGYLKDRGRNVFLVRARGDNAGGLLSFSTIKTTKDLVGKRIRIKAEVIEDE